MIVTQHTHTQKKKCEIQRKAKKHMWKSSCLKSTCGPVSVRLLDMCYAGAGVDAKCAEYAEKWWGYTRPCHGNLADNETLQQAAVPAATSHPVVIF